MLTSAITTAEILGGRRTLKVNIESDRDLIQAVNKGLPVEALMDQDYYSYGYELRICNLQ
ncbi:MAG: hypothetical protein QNJ60_06605 [Xenococcaceae cyanobacterium MO_188.B19]|nr:hypothetical protein [Xenococcaceae cyanobacterium MO_188.B19]